jgi:predicted RNA polymerase sigma factor
MAAATRRAIDRLRRRKTLERKHQELGRVAEARAEFERAAGLTRTARERHLLLARAAACAGGSGS